MYMCIGIIRYGIWDMGYGDSVVVGRGDGEMDEWVSE